MRRRWGVIALIVPLFGTSCALVEPTPRDPNSAQEVMDGKDVTLTLPGVTITIPGAAAPEGVTAKAVVASGPAAPEGTLAMSSGVEITLDGRQPTASLTVTFDVDPTLLASSPELRETMAVRSTQGGQPVVLTGRYDDATHRFTVQTPHLSWFQVWGFDLGSIVEEARDAVMTGLGLEHPEPDCTGDPVTVQGATVSAVSPPVAWVCVAAEGDDAVVTIHPNSAIPYRVTSAQAKEIVTDPASANVMDATMIAVARQLLLLDAASGAVSSTSTARVLYAGAPHDASIVLDQYPALLLLSILARTTETISEVTGRGVALTALVDGVDCLGDVMTVAPPGAALDGERIGAFVRAFFGCVGTVGGDTLSAAGKVILSVAAAAPAFLVSSLLGIVNELTGEANATVAVEVVWPKASASRCSLESLGEGYVREMGSMGESDGFGSAPEVVACDGTWAIFSSGGLGDTWSMMHWVDRGWSRAFGFPSGTCRAEMVTAGATDEVLDAVNWSC